MEWELLKPEKRVVSRLVGELGIHEATARVLANRGVKDPDAAKGYIKDPLRLLHDPFRFSHMERAVERVIKALKNREKILVFGDYDADGITGAALLYLFLRELGCLVDVFIPHRINHGYGLSFSALKELDLSQFSLVITVDCGIGSVAEIGTLVASGLDVIVTDHHTPGALIPPALAVINPKLDEGYPFGGLSGVGVAMKLVEGVALRLGGESARREVLKKFMPLVALGTVADVMELMDENRFFVKYGLKLASNLCGIKALMEVSGLGDKNPRVWDVSFILAPRINASGRMETARYAFDLLVEEDFDRALELARYLNSLNAKRQREEERVVEEALSLFRDPGVPTVVLWGEGWHPGVIGIAASKLVSELERPVILISFNGSDVGRGSGRSYQDVDLYMLVSSASRYLENFGGHRKAVGLSVKRDKLDLFVEKIYEAASSIEVSPAKLYVDAELALEDLEPSFIRELLQLAPFGEGFEEPLFVFRNVKPRFVREIAKGGVIFQAVQGKVGVDAVSFEPIDVVSSVFCDIVASVEVSEWNGEKRLRLRCRDAKRRG